MLLGNSFRGPACSSDSSTLGRPAIPWRLRDRGASGACQDAGSFLVGDRAAADTLVDDRVAEGALVEDEAAAGGLGAFVAGRDPRALWSTAWGAWRCLRRPSMSRAAPPADASARLSARSVMPRGGRRARRRAAACESGAYDGGVSSARARSGLGRTAPSSSSQGSDEMHSQHKSGSMVAAASIATTATAVAFAVRSDMRAGKLCTCFGP